MAIKRNATAILPIEVGIPIENLRSIEFLFKKEKNPNAEELLKKTYLKDEIEIKADTSNSFGFTMLMRLKPKETYRLPAGKVYMDTYPTLNDGNVPIIPIVTIDDILETLYKEARKDGRDD